VYSAGANVAVAQVAGSGNNQNNLQITGAANVTAIGVGQRIENNNSYDLAGQTVTLSVGMSNSLLSNVTWTASYANTSNTFGTIGTPTKVQISTGTFTVNSTFSQYSTQIAVPANATTGVEVILSVGAQTSGTWVIGNAQLELGSAASAFEVVDFGTELIMCKRYYQIMTGFMTATGSGSTGCGAAVYFAPQMRTSPTVSLSAALQITRAVTQDYTQSSANISIAANGSRVSNAAVCLDFLNFASLPTDSALPQIISGGNVLCSAEL
jgi:hypothetical protein